MSVSKELVCDENGNIISLDERVFSDVMQNQLAYIKQSAAEEILVRYPEFKQRNAALGVLSTEEVNEMKRGIEAIRNYSHLLENQLAGISWDGKKNSQSAACDAVQAVMWNFSSQPPNPTRRFTAYQFLLRFTPQERMAYRAAAFLDPQIADFMALAQAAQEILTTDPMTIAGMNYLVTVGILTESRKNQILGVEELSAD